MHLQWCVVTLTRQCSRTACGQGAVSTLTYVYAEQTAVLGPLATYAEPHSYDMCSRHAASMTAPRGWDIVRLDPPEGTSPPADDLVALAEAVRERRGSAPSAEPQTAASSRPPPETDVRGRRGHLRVLRDS